MNPFVAFLILFPLLVAGVFTLGAAYGLMKHGLQWDIVAAFVFFSAICGCLIVLLKRTSRGPYLDFPGSGQVDVSVRKKLTARVLLAAYLVLGFFALLLLHIVNIESLRNWVGLTFILFGLALWYSGISQLHRAKTFQPQVSSESLVSQLQRIERSLASLVRTRNFLLFSATWTGLSLIVLYWLAEGARYVSLLDMLGFLFLMFSIWIWIALYRISLQKKMLALKRRLE